MPGTTAISGTISTTPRKPITGDGTVAEIFGANDLVASASMQPAVAGAELNCFQEVTQFIGEVARQLSIPPHAAWRRVADIGKAIFEQGALGS